MDDDVESDAAETFETFAGFFARKKHKHKVIVCLSGRVRCEAFALCDTLVRRVALRGSSSLQAGFFFVGERAALAALEPER